MNPWIALIIGLIVGWLVELLIDVFYWRKRRLCPDDNALALQASLEQAQSESRSLKISLGENQDRLGQLETDLSMRDARITGLTADLNAHKDEITSLKGQINEFISNQDIYKGEIDLLNGRIQQLDASLAARNNELEVIRTELGGIDAEAKEFGFGSIFANGGLSLAGFWHNLKDRFSSLKADLNARNTEVSNLKMQIEGSSVDAAGLDNRISGLEADLAARNAELGSLRAELADKNGELGRLYAELDDFNAGAKSLGLGPLFAGGGLAISGFFANLKDRFASKAEMTTRGAEFDVSLTAKDAEIGNLQLQVSDLEEKLSVCNASLVEMRTNLGAEYKGAQGLSMVWGMNTAASNLLANRGIYTYNQLAATKVEDVNDAIELSGAYYPDMNNTAIHGSWVEQSRLAGSGDWDALYAYQQQRFDMASLRDDLKKIWGIGPKIEQVLNENGIYLFAQLASVPADRITEILRRAGSRFQMSTGKLHESWPEQARLADKGDWEAFQTLHDTLDWSKVQGK